MCRLQDLADHQAECYFKFTMLTIKFYSVVFGVVVDPCCNKHDSLMRDVAAFVDRGRRTTRVIIVEMFITRDGPAVIDAIARYWSRIAIVALVIVPVGLYCQRLVWNNYMVRHNYRNNSFKRHNLVNVRFIYMKISGTIAEEMISLQI